MTAGAPSTGVLLVESGLVKAVLPGHDGDDPVAGLFSAGELLGEIGVLSGRPRSAHVIALTTGWVVEVAGAAFPSGDRDVHELLLRSWIKRQNHADERQRMQHREVPTRVALSLQRWAWEFGVPTERGMEVRGLSQQDIAQAVAASAKSVEAVLHELREGGLLHTGRLRYALPDPDALDEVISRATW